MDLQRFLSSAWWASLAMTGLTVMVGLPRVLVWVLAPGVPSGVAWPLVLGLVSLGLEVGLLLGWPLGYVECAFRSHERGEALVRESLGESPGERLRSLWPISALLAAAVIFSSASWGHSAREPGHAVQAMIERAREACERTNEPAALAVPLLGATWLCAPNVRPALLARPPGGSSAVLLAADLEVGPDLARLRASDVEWLLRHDPPVRLRAAQVVISGLSPYSARSSIPYVTRGLLLALSAAASAHLATWATLRARPPARWMAWVLGLSGPLAALGMLRALERSAVAGGYLLGVPTVAVLVSWGLGASLVAWRRGGGWEGAVDGLRRARGRATMRR